MTGPTIHFFELQVGLVGRPGTSQVGANQLPQTDRRRAPQGWHNQLPNEPKFLATYRFMRRSSVVSGEEGPVEYRTLVPGI